MTLKIRIVVGSAVFWGALLSASFAGAQQQAATQTSFSYDLKRETILQGTVLSYTAASTVAPIGPHAMIETSSGTVDVHLGNADRMKINDVFLAVGDTVKIQGEMQNSGNVFLARVLRKGNQVVTLRNPNGLPLAPARESAATPKPRSFVRGAQ